MFGDIMTDYRIRTAKEGLRFLERQLKNYIPPAGEVLEKVNNTVDSGHNLVDAFDPHSRLSHFCSDLTVEKARRVFKTGDHIATMRSVYSHHGIYDGYGGVYEYNEGYVRHVDLYDFAAGDRLYRVDESRAYSPNEIIDRAESRMYEDKYNLLYNNCENFATWCRLGGKIEY